MSLSSGAATTFDLEISSFSSRAPDAQKAQRRLVVVLAETAWFSHRTALQVASQTLMPSSRGLFGSVAAISASCSKFRVAHFFQSRD